MKYKLYVSFYLQCLVEILFLLFEEYLVISARDAPRNGLKLMCNVSDIDESWNVPRNDEKNFQCEIVVTHGQTDRQSVVGKKRVSAIFCCYTCLCVSSGPVPTATNFLCLDRKRPAVCSVKNRRKVGGEWEICGSRIGVREDSTPLGCNLCRLGFPGPPAL